MHLSTDTFQTIVVLGLLIIGALGVGNFIAEVIEKEKSTQQA
jgi:hypothetical protein